ncbi:MAG: hypothetical protein HY299_08765 [Verrucomicrobia bacterium]|nr:hypothetical protein [Verrucomicrobiota bacterium]
MERNAFRPRTLLVVLAVWLALALLLGGLGVVAAIRPPWPQVLLLGLVGCLVAAYRRSPGFRGWVLSVPISALVAVNLVRFVGIYFLWLHEHRRLPFGFAVPGGWGDICVAAMSAMLLILRPTAPRIYWIWNTLGLADILFVVATATRLAFADPVPMAPLLRLPLSLLPTFAVPIIIFTHLVVFLRLHRGIAIPNR